MSRKQGAYAEVTARVAIWTDRQPEGRTDAAMAETLVGFSRLVMLAENKQLRQTPPAISHI